MQVTNNGITYRIIDNGTKFLDSLPPKVYSIHFHPMSGYWLSERSDITVGGFKIYGNTPKRVEKVFRTFGLRNRNLGILLSGEKGMGKSVFMRCLSENAVRRGFPVLVVNENIPGISDFISKIEQECIVLFDEFEKIFPRDGDLDDNEHSSQSQFLSLFDGMDSGKKMFVIAINDTYRISEYFINRPGRFYYHFCFDYLTEYDVREYCKDMLENYDKDIVDKICVIAKFHDVNYDILSSIVTEINNGYGLKETINDLNIDIDESSKFYDFEMVIDGHVLKGSKFINDKSERNDMYVNLREVNSNRCCISVYFNTDDEKYDDENGCLYIPSDKIRKTELESPFGKFTAKDVGDDIKEKCERLIIRPHEFGNTGTLDYLF